MSAYIADWLNLLIRWAHLIVGIGWIGTSFFFIGLDLGLRKRTEMRRGVSGTAWIVHGGGFYHVEKFLVAPDELPPDLMWYRWEAYLTWLTGFFLLVVQYYFNADVYLIDPDVLRLLPAQAIAISVLSFVVSWFAYDWLCRSAVGRTPWLLSLSIFAMLVGFAWFFGQVFSGRGALIHVGGIIGAIMATNVFGIIVPNQKKITAALLKGEAPDPRLGAIGKQRSVHNNYLTLPVLVMMVSNHYPILTNHPQNWLIVALIIVVGVTVRHFISRHEADDEIVRYVWTLPAAAAVLGLAIWLTAPRPDPAMAGLVVTDAEVLAIAANHCAMCHAARPSHEGFDEPPKGVRLQTADDLRRHRQAVFTQAVATNAMPLGNETGITEEERRRLGAWLAAQ